MMTLACFAVVMTEYPKLVSANYNESMSRLPAAPTRSSRNVRNGPSPLQTRVSGLLREARWIFFAALASWLALVLATWTMLSHFTMMPSVLIPMLQMMQSNQ